MNTQNLESKFRDINAFMKVVDSIADPSTRKAIAEGGDFDHDDVPDALVAALRSMSEDELRFLARLKGHLDCVGFFDEQDNPKLYYF